MVYNSPMDDLQKMGWKSFSMFMSCSANVPELMYKLRKSKTETNRVFCPQRIVRSLIDFKISQKNRLYKKREYLELIVEGIDLCKKVYSTDQYESELNSLEGHINKYPQWAEINNNRTKEVEDKWTWEATNPSKNAQTAYELSRFKKMMMISIAHGSLRAATDIFLRYQDMKPENDSVIYPVRFSTDKFADKKPRINSVEAEYIKQESESRKVVIFDEDVSSGETLVKAVKLFEQFLGKKVYAVSNQWFYHHWNSGIIPRKLLKGEFGFSL